MALGDFASFDLYYSLPKPWSHSASHTFAFSTTFWTRKLVGVQRSNIQNGAFFLLNNLISKTAGTALGKKNFMLKGNINFNHFLNL